MRTFINLLFAAALAIPSVATASISAGTVAQGPGLAPWSLFGRKHAPSEPKAPKASKASKSKAPKAPKALKASKSKAPKTPKALKAPKAPKQSKAPKSA